MKGSKILGIIPARKGSKSLNDKNLQCIKGKPLLWYAINVSLACEYIDRTIVSSECPEIISTSKEFGAEAPFVRPGELAEDRASDQQVLKHTLEWLADNESYVPDIVVLLRCTTPFKTVYDIKQAIEILQEGSLDSVRSVTRAEGVFHPYWMFEADSHGVLTPCIPGKSIDKYYQRQLLPDVFRLNGVIDVLRRETLYGSNMYGNRMGKVEIPKERAIDIDDQFDLDLAKYLVEKYDLL